MPYSPSGRNAPCIIRDVHRCSATVVESYAPYCRSGRNALCIVRDAHRCSAVVVESYVPYSRSGRNALCVVRDAHRNSAVVVESYVPYSRSGRNALCVVRDAHRYSAVVVESYAPYSRSGRNAPCIVRDAHRCSAAVELTQLTFLFFQAGNPPQIDADCCSKLRGRSTKTPERRAALKKRDSKPIKDVLETNSSWPQRLARWWVSSRPSRHDAVSSDVES